VPRHGIAYVPQGRRLFAELTVAENLGVGLLVRGGDAALRRHVLDLFPRLEERLDQQARTLSGGEQQMLAIGRGADGLACGCCFSMSRRLASRRCWSRRCSR